MANTLPLELLYRIYKAETGDVIDGKYMKVSGAFHTDADHSVDENGFVHRSMYYSMAIKNLTTSQSYFAEWEMKRGPTPDSEVNKNYYHEPFVDSSVAEYSVESYKLAVRAVTQYYKFGTMA